MRLMLLDITAIQNQLWDWCMQYFQFIIIGFGVLVVLAAIFNWSWMFDRPTRYAIEQMIYVIFGKTGYRIFIGLLGLATIALGIWYLELYPNGHPNR